MAAEDSAKSAKLAEQWITHTLATEQRPVTFRELAREIGCHIHSAKNLLLRYHNSHPDVTPTYLLSGPLLGTSTLSQTSVAVQAAPATQSLAHMSATQKVRIVDMDQVSDDERNSEADAEEQREEEELEAEADADAEANNEDWEMDESEAQVARWGVVLVNSGDLDDKKKLFVQDQASVHIYALTPAPLKDPAQLLSSSVLLRQHASYRDPKVYGSIWGDQLVAATKPLRDGAMDFSKKLKAKVEEKKVKAEPVKKEPVKEPVPVKKETKPQLSRNNSQSKPIAKSKRRIITSDDEDDEPPAPATKTETKLSAKNPLEPTSSMVRNADQAAMEAMMAMDVDESEEEIEQEKPKAKNATVKAEPKAKPDSKDKKRKRKQVKKSKVEMDERGYMVTKDYYTEESCSGSDTDVESIPAPKTAPKGKTAAAKSSAPSSKQPSRAGSAVENKPKPAAKGPAKKGQVSGQSTLAGFFTKK